MNLKSKYISSAFLLLLTSVIVKVIGAVYKIPLTAFIGAVGRGYFAVAYNLCLPIHAVTMGAFPVALSRLVSKYNSSNNSSMVHALKKGSSKLFFVVGIVGMGIMLVLAKPYSVYIAGAPKSIYTILVLAPSILFSSMTASYRGYYEGFMNMFPTSASQTIEALFKMIFGLIFAKLSMAYLYSYYSALGMSQEQVLSIIYPFTSAFAMLGVTLGSFVSLCFVFVYHLINRDRDSIKSSAMVRTANKELLSFSFPIMISCAVQSFFQFLDTATIQYSLGKVSTDTLKSVYASALSLTSVSDGDLTTYVYGLFSSALDFKNLIPGVTMALGVCAVPAVSGAMEMKNDERLSSLINSIYKYTVLLSSLGGIAMALCSTQILSLFYSASSPDIVEGCNDLVKYFSLTVPIYSIAGTAVFMVQAVGHPEKSIAPYVISGIVRVVLNVILVSNPSYILFGCVISGAVGYMIMCILNMHIVHKVTNTKLDIMSVLIKPIFVTICTAIASNYLFSQCNFTNSTIYNLLIKMSILVGIYCILCLLCGLLNLKEIFSTFKKQKNS